jgi:peptidoglycan/LPS O-acetylase OafA/YrhL
MIKPLTGMRAVAAFWVMMLHFSGVIAFPGPLDRIAAFGATGVSLFFVLSGFVLTVNYQARFSTGLGRWREFARARVARIVPVYLVGLALAGAVMVWARHGYYSAYAGTVSANPTLKDIAAVFPLQLFAVNAWVPVLSATDLWNTTGWSVSTELGFYAFFPLIAYLVTSRLRSKGTMVGTWVALMLAQAVVFTTLLSLGYSHLSASGQIHLRLALYEMPIFRLPEFMVGCVAGALFLRLHQDRSGLLVTGGGPVRNGLLLGGLAWCGLMMFTPDFISHPAGSLRAVLLLQLSHDVLFVPGLSAIVFALALGPTFLGPILDSRLAQALGLASYSLYVVHFTLLLPFDLHWLSRGHRPPVWEPLLLVLAIIGVALLVHHFVELPARRAILSSGRRDPRPSSGGRRAHGSRSDPGRPAAGKPSAGLAASGDRPTPLDPPVGAPSD